ncbi:glycosyl transferase family 4 group [Antarctobacter heliothermus]|uniref:Glycosyl transferase family 4 group n=1 Tax=Antarctobacter heliothermus TaxID=74033 RepID=A0A222E114_9RHOB|nr:glycosyltransferase [Antarctobacter heliothermus]ASP19909.1 glycosyl transferase family 4 group [Antarctobacter heliothermus]
MAKPVIVFAGAVYPGQFGALCDYLRAAGLAETYFLTTPGHQAKNAHRGKHILGFKPDGPVTGAQRYYYTAKLERSAHIGRGLLSALQQFERHKKIDVVVTHSLWGAPHFLYDEIDAAIVSYIEFPSFRAHGWDPAYPPDQAQRMVDRNTEMLNFHQALCSDLVICPSQHAKSMFPEALQSNIEVQLEGFAFEDTKALELKERSAPLTIGFSARDLSNAKGFDTYVRLVDKLVERGLKANFVALGGSTGSTYGYEQQWVERKYSGAVDSFRDHLMKIYPRAAEVIEFPGKLPYDDFVQKLADIDIFLYPLRFGVANWGLVEILGRGGCVLAPDRGYPAELIQDDVNGRLLPDDDGAWIQEIIALSEDPERRYRYGQAARARARLLYSVQAVAPRYLGLFRLAAEKRQARIRNGS